MWLNADECELEIINVLHYTRGHFSKNTAKRDFAVISCRLSGESTFLCRGQSLQADPQHYLIIPPRIEYSQSSEGEEILCVHMRIKGLELDRIKEVYCPSLRVRENFLKLFELWQEKRIGYVLRCKALVYEILSEFVRLTEPGVTTKVESLIAPSVDDINQNFYKADFSLEQAIARSHVSQAYFRRLFKKLYEISPVGYVNLLRVERAKSLLLCRTYTLGEVARACGFLNDKYFFLVFKKITGSTPSEWCSLYG